MFVQQGPWDNDVTMEFIENYRQESMLWDPKHRDYKNKAALNLAWERIKANMSIECSVVELKKKKESLMASYRFQNRRRRGKPGYLISWFAFELMDSFLGRVYNCEDISFSDQELLNNSDDHQYLEKSRPIKKERKSISSTALYTPRKRSSEAFSYSQMPDRDTVDSKTEFDECELYGKLLAKKLRRLDERQRDLVMHEIDNIMFRAKMNSKTGNNNSESSSSNYRPSNKMSRIKSPESPVFIITDQNEHYEEEYLEDPMQ